MPGSVEMNITETPSNTAICAFEGVFMPVSQQEGFTLPCCAIFFSMKKERLLLQPLLVVIPLGIIPQQR